MRQGQGALERARAATAGPGLVYSTFLLLVVFSVLFSITIAFSK